jgi:hypothetical protein
MVVGVVDVVHVAFDVAYVIEACVVNAYTGCMVLRTALLVFVVLLLVYRSSWFLCCRVLY